MATSSPADEKRLSFQRFNQSEQVINKWAIVLEFGTEYKEVFNAAFWAHHAAKLKVRDEITVTNDEGNLYAKLVVLDCDRSWAKVGEIIQKEFKNTEKVADVDGYEAVWKGPQLKFCIIRKSDQVIMQQGFVDKVAAKKAAIDFQRSLAA